MSGSPAWLTIALTTLSTVTISPQHTLSTGIRTLPSQHILHHLNRWSRHVWRPAVSPSSLTTLTHSEPSKQSISALGTGACSLLAALLEAVARCDVQSWLDVLGVLFLADDPWTIEVGRSTKPRDVDYAVDSMTKLFEMRKMVADVAAEMSAEVVDLPPVETELAPSVQSFAELRCRVAALQLQLDDVTAVVRRNEENTKNLVSSFHFWSLLLLDEIRACRQQIGNETTAGYSGSGRGLALVKEESTNGCHPERIGNEIHERNLVETQVAMGSNVHSEEQKKGGSGKSLEEKIEKIPVAEKKTKTRRIFRDGKWVTL